MAIRAVAADDENTPHLIIGLNRESADSLLERGVFTLPHRFAFALSEDSNIVLLFVETDEDLAKVSP
jgi:hypothetical protein